LIGLSPLSTGHPPSFQPRSVRSSTRFYPRFNLPMDSSLGFGSTPRDYDRPIQTRFPFGFTCRLNLATKRKSLTHYAKGTRSPRTNQWASTACRRTVSGTISLPCQGYFSPFPHGTSSLSVARTYLALRDGPRRFPQGSTCPGVLGVMQ